MYAIVSITEYYGPKTEKMPVAFSASKAAADRYAAIRNEWEGGYLSHNQASQTGYIVRRVDVARCARGYNGAPMYLGIYLPSAEELAKRPIHSEELHIDAAADQINGIVREHD